MKFSLPVLAMRQHQIILSANSFCRNGGLSIKNRSLDQNALRYFTNQFFYSKPLSTLPNLIGKKNHCTVPIKPCLSSSMPSSRALIFSPYSSDATSGQKKGNSKLRVLLIGFGLGALVGLGYAYKKMNQRVMPIANLGSSNNMLYSEAPPVKLVTKKVVNPNDTSNLKLTLFQYEPCPFCQKVRAFLDFSGLSYDIVEVHPVTKKELGWSPYKKVPIVILQIKEGYQQLNDSSMIISALSSLLMDTEQDVLKLVECFPKVDSRDADGKLSSEIMNRYFLMFGENDSHRTKESIVEERKWRQWSDNVLMHTLSPNIYRTWDEALEAFEMFSKKGDWEKIFSSWERQVAIYVGAAAMYMIGKRLKKRHNLLEDTRQSLYQEVTYYLKSIEAKGTRFMGGDEPNLADLAVFGCLSSIDGTRSFKDLIENVKKVEPWYRGMKSVIDSRKGQIVSSAVI